MQTCTREVRVSFTFDAFRFESSCVFEDARDAPSRLKDGLSQSISPALLARTTARNAPVFTSTKVLARSPMRAERSQSLRGVATIPHASTRSIIAPYSG